MSLDSSLKVFASFDFLPHDGRSQHFLQLVSFIHLEIPSAFHNSCPLMFSRGDFPFSCIFTAYIMNIMNTFGAVKARKIPYLGS
jgi:hypothetical protein